MVNYFFSFCCNYPNLPLFHLVSLSQIPTVPRWQGTCLKKKIKIILTLDENPSVHLPRYWPRVLLKTPVCAKHYTSSHHFILYTLRVQLHCLVILQNILDKSSYSFSIVDWFTCVGYTYFLVFKSTHTTKTSTYLIFFFPTFLADQVTTHIQWVLEVIQPCTTNMESIQPKKKEKKWGNGIVSHSESGS